LDRLRMPGAAFRIPVAGAPVDVIETDTALQALRSHAARAAIVPVATANIVTKHSGARCSFGGL